MVVLALLSACGKPAAGPGVASTAIPPGHPYTVGTDPTFPPFEWQDDQGNLVGFDVDVVNAVAAKAGIAVQFVSTPWEGAISALAQGDRDMLVSAITITESRRQGVDFSDPYFDAQELIAVDVNSPITRFAELKDLKVGVQIGATGEEVVGRIQGRNSSNMKRFESLPLALKELLSGGVEAVVVDNGVVTRFLDNNQAARLKVVRDDSIVPEHYGIAVRKGNQVLLERLNRGLRDIRADGSYDRIYRKYFGTGAPGTVAAAASGAGSTSAVAAPTGPPSPARP